MKFYFCLFFLLFAFLPIKSAAQTKVSDNVQKGGKTLTSVPVTVADRDGRYITGLEKKDFTLYENGVEQKIVSFATFDEPVSIALLLDTSGSTKDSLAEIKDAAADFIELLDRQDRCLIATFDAKVNILNNLTNDRKLLKASLAEARTADKEGSVLFNAIEEVAQKSFAGVEGRKVIVVLSDGKDFGSSIGRSDLMSRLEESDVAIYSIFYQSGGGFNKMVIAPDGTLQEGKAPKKTKEKKPKKKKNYSILIPVAGDVFTAEEAKLAARAADVEAVNSLQTMSDTTAGRFYQSDTQNLGGVFKKIAGELRQLYRLGYYSQAAGDAARPVIIKVSKPDAVVRAGGKFRAKQL